MNQRGSEPLSSDCGLWTAGIGITWGFGRNADSRAPLQTSYDGIHNFTRSSGICGHVAVQ